MATQQDLTAISLEAENDLSTKQYYIVEQGGSAGQVDVCDNAGDIPYGVLQNKPTAGAAARVAIAGISKVVSDGSGAAIAAGDFVGTNASGKAVKKTADGDHVLGIALDASAADGIVIRVLLRQMQRAS